MLYIGVEGDDNIRKLYDECYSDYEKMIFDEIQYPIIIEMLQYSFFLAENLFIDESIGIVNRINALKISFREENQIIDNMNKMIEKGESMLPVMTIKGWISFVLSRCAIPKGRKHIDEIIEITLGIAQSEELYYKFASLWALSQLAFNRLSINPNDRKQLFLDNDIEKALLKSKRIEKTIFSLAEEISQKNNNVKKSFAPLLAHCMSMIRALDKSEADKLLEIIKRNETESDALKEYIPILVYFSFIREFAFKDWKYSSENLYDDLSSFETTIAEKYFEYLKRILNKKIEIKQMISYQIFAVFRADVENKLKNDINDLDSFKNNLQNKAFELFEELLTVYDETIFSYVFDSMMFNINKNLKHDKGFAIIKKYLEVSLTAMINAPHPLYYYYKEPGDELFIPIYNLSKEKFKEILKVFIKYHEGGKYFNRKLNLYKTYEKIKELSSGDKEFEFEEIRKALEKYYSYLK